MSITRLVEYRKVRLNRGVLIQGLPGIGLVGKIAVDYIVSELGLEKVAEVYSGHFLLPTGNAGLFITSDAFMRLPRYEIYLYKGERDILFLAGDVQPVSWGQYEVAERVLDYFTSIGGEEVIAVCGTTAGSGEGPQVYFVADTEETKKRLEELGFKPSEGGTITGACGILPGLARLRGLRAYILMGSTKQAGPDPEAGREVVKALMKIFDIKVSLRNLDRIIEEIREKEKEMEKLKEMAKEREGPPHYYV